MSAFGNISDFDSVLIKKATEGDELAFKQLYDKISGKMYSLCLRYAKDKDEANDFFQDGCIKLYRNLATFRNEGSFEGWARRVFVTTCLDALKKRKIQFADIDENIDLKNTNNLVQDKLSLDELMRIIQNLPDGYRTIINLYVIEDFSHKEIADILGITENGSKSKLHKARLYLKNILPQEN